MKRKTTKYTKMMILISLFSQLNIFLPLWLCSTKKKFRGLIKVTKSMRTFFIFMTPGIDKTKQKHNYKCRHQSISKMCTLPFCNFLTSSTTVIKLLVSDKFLRFCFLAIITTDKKIVLDLYLPVAVIYKHQLLHLILCIEMCYKNEKFIQS